MKNRTSRAVWGILLLLAYTPTVQGQENLQRLDRTSISPLSLPAATPDELGVVDSLANWWGRHKRALQYLSACGIASASLSYALIVGIGNPVGGAVLGLLGASIMVAICL